MLIFGTNPLFFTISLPENRFTDLGKYSRLSVLARAFWAHSNEMSLFHAADDQSAYRPHLRYGDHVRSGQRDERQ